MEKVIVIDYRTNEVSKNIFKDKRVQYISLCGHNSFAWRCIDRAFMAFGLGGWLLKRQLQGKKLRDYSLIIINETIYPAQLIDYVRKKAPNAKIIYWLWDTAATLYNNLRFYDSKREFDKLLKSLNKNGAVATSFDKDDCVQFKFLYYPQVVPYFSMDNMNDSQRNHSLSIEQDIFFVGRDKGRLALLMRLKEQLMRKGVSYKFWILPDSGKVYSDREQTELTKGPLFSYDKIVEQNLRSKAILDIVQIGQQGLTWRPIEALLYKRKLITNFRRIKEYDFYDSANIFILGEDSMEKLKAFLDSEYKETTIDPIAQYTFTGWLNKYLKNTEGIVL